MKVPKQHSQRAFVVRGMLGLYTACYLDVACASDISSEDQEFDRKTIESRLANEGVSFFTKSLPLLGKNLDRVLSQLSTSEPSQNPFPGWTRWPMTRYPRFLGTLFAKVLAPDGTVRFDADPNALGRLRQLFYLFYKLELPSSDEQNAETLRSFVQTDSLLPDPKTGEGIFDMARINSEPLSIDPNRPKVSQASKQVWILQRARDLVHRVLGGYDPLAVDGLMPKHGPGAVATGEKSHEKPIFRRYYEHLHAVFPYDTFMSYNLSSVNDEWQGWQELEFLRESTAKVVLVPKDSRGPRIISCEPLEVQWIQQALMKRLVYILEEHPLTRGHVNFKRQDVNRQLALCSSTGAVEDSQSSWITMDMKDASDRVSLALVRYLFPKTWVRALEACRSAKTRLPDGQIVELKKFAPMGSAVCFPVEALVFYAICVATQQYVSGQRLNTRPTRAECDELPFVYGDDIIIRSHYYDSVVAALESVYLKVNLTKCCVGRFFRESCGMDAFKGVDVTPLKIRRPLDHRFRSTTLISWCEYHNWLSRRGYDGAARWIRNCLAIIQDARHIPVMDESWLNGQIPGYAYLHVAGEQPHALSGQPLISRFNREFHQREWLVWGVTSRVKTRHVPGWSEMLRRASQKGAQLLTPVKGVDQLPTPLVKAVEAKAYEYALAHGVVRRCAWYAALVA